MAKVEYAGMEVETGPPELSEEKLAQWRGRNANLLCCDKAKPGGFCVCMLNMICSEHGSKHVGTHD